MHDIFLSYASEDRDTVKSLIIEMFRAGITNFWWDQIQIKLADSIPSRIDDGIATSRYMIAFLSKRYLQKHWTKQELDAVRMLERPVIPVWIDVNADDIRRVSPTLSSKRAFLLSDNHDELVRNLAELLESNPETSFARSKDRREELTVYWGLAWLYIQSALGILDENSAARLRTLDRSRGNNLPTWRRHMAAQLNYSYQDIRRIRSRLPPLGDRDASLVILALLKRESDVWFPTYDNELEALDRAGIDTW